MPNFFLAGMSTSVVHQANVIALSKGNCNIYTQTCAFCFVVCYGS
jgi:hypothetical protein